MTGTRGPGRWCRALCGVVAVALLPASVRAQPSPYLPLDDAAYALIDALQARRLLPSLPVLDRPYTLSQVRRAVAALDTTRLEAAPRAWARRILRAAAKYDDGRGAWDRRAEAPARSAPATPTPVLTAHLNAGAMGTAQTSGLRELMLADSASGVHPGANVRLAIGTGPLVAALRFRGDQAWRDDVEYAGFEGGLPGSPGGGAFVAARAEDGYLSAQWPMFELFAGRVSRNWGPPAYDGLLLGRAAWSYDHLLVRVGDERFRITWLAARLNDFGPITRWFTARRAAIRAFGAEFGISESVVYSGQNRPFEWALASPMVPAITVMYNDNITANVNAAADVAWPTRAGLFTAQLFVDDFQLDGVTPKPPMYGATLVADGMPLRGAHRWFASYTEVSNLTYRNTTPADVYTQQFVSLGRGFTDHREVRIGADLALWAHGTVRPYAAFRQQGTGTYRNPFPPEAEWPQFRRILQSPVMGVARVGVQATMVTAGAFEVQADLGINRVTTVNYVPGTSRTAPEGRIRVQWEPPSFARRWMLAEGPQ